MAVKSIDLNSLLKNDGSGTLKVSGILMNDAWHKTSSSHGKWYTRLSHKLGGAVSDQYNYNVRYKLEHEKTSMAFGAGVTVGIVAVSTGAGIGIAAGTKGIATPIALAGLAAGTWVANQVGEALTGVVKNQFRKRRLRNWLTRYPDARSEMSKSDQLALTVNASDSIRRSVDHFTKAGTQATKLLSALSDSDFGAFAECSQMIGLVKHNMKFTHEVGKTELYLLPAIDLGILLLNTHKAYAAAFAQEIENYETAIVAHLYSGRHSNCKSCCYRQKMSGVPVKPLKGIVGSTPTRGSVGSYRAPSKDIDAALDALIELRETFATDLGSTKSPGIARNTGTSIRLKLLYKDASRRYNNPAPLKRIRHYARNHLTRKTRTEHVMNVVNKGASFGVTMATSVGGSAFGTHVATPFIQQPLAVALRSGVPALNVLNSVVSGGADVAVKTISGIPGSVAKSGGKSTVKAGAKAAAAVANFLSNYVQNKKANSTGLLDVNARSKDFAIDSVETKKGLKKAAKASADGHFKKAARHMHSAHTAITKLEKDTKSGITIASCDDAMAVAAGLTEFIWHMDKSMRALGKSLAVVTVIAAQLEEWGPLEEKLWDGIDRASIMFMDAHSKKCACDHSSILNFSPCYGPGLHPNVPKRRMTNL